MAIPATKGIDRQRDQQMVPRVGDWDESGMTASSTTSRLAEPVRPVPMQTPDIEGRM